MKLKLHYETQEEFVYPLEEDYTNGCDCWECLAIRKRIAEKAERDRIKVKSKEITRGLAIFESTPQMRTLLMQNNKGSQKYAFPYIINVVTYSKNDNMFMVGFMILDLESFFVMLH
jgi:hypothetical protein